MFIFLHFLHGGWGGRILCWLPSCLTLAFLHPLPKPLSSAVTFTYVPVLIRPEVFLFSSHSHRQGLNYGHTRRATSQHTITQIHPVHQVTQHVTLRVCTSAPQLACQATVASAVVPISFAHSPRPQASLGNLLRTCPAPWWPLPEPLPWKYSIHLLGLLSSRTSQAQNSLPLKVNCQIRTSKLFPTPCVHSDRCGQQSRCRQRG